MSARPQRRQFPFPLYVAGAFVLTAVMTALITASVLAIAWNVNRKVFTDADIYVALAVAGLIALSLAIVLGFFFANSIIHPVRRISKTASAIKNGNLSARTELHGDDELSQLGESFDEMAESIERDRDLERQLIGDVAHELRTPLMAIQATVEAIQDGVFSADEERLETLSSETRRLGRLVEALLHLNRLENGTIAFSAKPLDLTELTEKIVMANQALIEASDLNLDVDLDDEVCIVGDRDLMQQAVSNLLSNAIRYTFPGGQVTVTLKRDRGSAALAVADTGIGISSDDLKLVFSRFWRADRARDVTSGGLGIGLALVKEVIDQHRGYISVESEPGMGSTFTMRIPLAADDPSWHIPSEKAAQRRAAKAAKREQERQRRELKQEQRKAVVEGERPTRSFFGVRVPLGTGKITAPNQKAKANTIDDADLTHGKVLPVSEMLLRPDSQGKVRDLYDLGDELLIVASDRISAFDYILEDEIPYKGEILTRISLFWFDLLSDVIDNHLISASVDDLPERFKPYSDWLAGRFMLVRKAEMFPVECIVRGYLAGSGLKEYQAQGTVCGVALPQGLVDSSKLPEAIYTPSTKADIGDHDENVSFAHTVEMLGEHDAAALRDASLGVYNQAACYAAERGIIIADTKFEFGMIDGKLTLADEVLTPDSSRFWPAADYEPGRSQASFDKQFVRDWLDANWDRQGTPPRLPEEVIQATTDKYIQAYEAITAQKFVPSRGLTPRS